MVTRDRPQGRFERGKIESQWRIILNSPEGLVIEDVGVTTISVTNDAEKVVAKLADLLGQRRLFYYDSTGQLDELLVSGGQFVGFAAGAPSSVKLALRVREE